MIKVYFSDIKGERITSDFSDPAAKLPLETEFIVCGAFIKAFNFLSASPDIPSKEEIKEAMNKFRKIVNEELVPSKQYIENPYIPNDIVLYEKNEGGFSKKILERIKTEPFVMFWVEYLLLRRAVQDWLFPHKIGNKIQTPKEAFAEIFKYTVFELPETEFKEENLYIPDFLLKENFPEGPMDKQEKQVIHTWFRYMELLKCFFEQRIWQAPRIPCFIPTTGELTTQTRCESLLPIAWLEIWTAIERNMYANFCSECGKVIALNKQKNKVVCECCAPIRRKKRLTKIENEYRAQKGLPLIENIEEAVKHYNARMKQKGRQKKKNSNKEHSCNEISND